ncbi:MAG TPA: class I SAM-dependent methyltransferase [Chthoniobacterales bacterium]|jgi:SAM-dependent methyltransferase|nr:class I SAM-dependent methyltransferase [Chthoniobacterales bacterium]
MQGLGAEEYIRERIEPTPGDNAYLHLTDLLLGLKTLMPSNRTRILDYGCGGSPYRPLFGACTYHRADLAGDLAVDFEYGPDSRLPAELADYDCVLSTQVLEHVLSPTAYLAEAYRVLKPGGHLLLSTHGLFGDHACPYDYWRWTVYGLRKLVEDTGFKVDRILKLTTGPRAAMFLAERELSRLRFKGPGRILHTIVTLFRFSLSSRGRDQFYSHMLHYATRVQFADAKRRHDACDASFSGHRVADEGEPGHDMYIAVVVLAHR